MKQPVYRCEDLIHLFDHLFSETENTVLLGGYDEPLYLPASISQTRHQLMFTKDYFASALHEIAHWCIAGPKRRVLQDFGYWYKPAGRDANDQKCFERAEARPQALEWLFTLATGRDFHLSVDNLHNSDASTDHFASLVRGQALDLISNGLPARASRFREGLSNFYGQNRDLPDVDCVMRYRFTI